MMSAGSAGHSGPRPGSPAEKSAFRLHLSGEVGKAEIEQLFPTIVATMKLQGRIILDLRGVATIDINAVTALCGIHRHVASRGKLIELDGVRPALLDEAIAGNGGFAPWAVCSVKKHSVCLWASN